MQFFARLGPRCFCAALACQVLNAMDSRMMKRPSTPREAFAEPRKLRGIVRCLQNLLKDTSRPGSSCEKVKPVAASLESAGIAIPLAAKVRIFTEECNDVVRHRKWNVAVSLMSLGSSEHPLSGDAAFALNARIVEAALVHLVSSACASKRGSDTAAIDRIQDSL